jgi:hypothetical protein
MKEAPITNIATQRRSRASGSFVARRAQAAAAFGLETAALVRVPAWFTTAQALRVADLKQVDRVHVEDRGLVRGAISRQVLATAPAHDLCVRWLNHDHAGTSPATSHAA